MKAVSGYAYPLHAHFPNPVWDFVKKEENKERLWKIFDKRLEPNILRCKSDDVVKLMREVYMASSMGIAYDAKKEGMYISWYSMIIDKIIECFMRQMPDDTVNIKVMIKILNWCMENTYYITGEYGDKIFDYMEEDMKKGGWKFTETRNQLVPFCTEDVGSGDLDSLVAINSFLNKVNKWNIWAIKEKELSALDWVSAKEEEFLKFNKKWIDYVKMQFNKDADIVKWYRQIRIKRKTHFDITLLVAIISAVYFETELFIYFDPYYFELWIADKNWLDFKRVNPYIVINFSNIIKTCVCPHCFESHFGKEKLKSVQTKPINNFDVIKNMFDTVLNQLSSICPDDVSLVIEGKVDDTSRVHEINEKLPNADVVGFTRHSGNNKKVKFIIKDDLKNCRERIKRK